MKKALLFLLLGLLGFPAAQADPFSDANQAFAEGRYDAAIQGYQALLDARGWSAPVLYDLGNAEFRAGHPGAALLAYERARLLAPRDPDLAANLAHVRAKGGLPDPRSHAERAASFLSADEWAGLGSLLLVLGCAALGTASALSGTGRRSLAVLGAAALAGTVLAAAALAVLWPGLSRAIVVVPNATVRLSPFDDAQPAFAPPEGASLPVLGRHDAWLLVGDGVHADANRRGWIAGREAVPVLPGK